MSFFAVGTGKDLVISSRIFIKMCWEVCARCCHQVETPDTIHPSFIFWEASIKSKLISFYNCNHNVIINTL